MIDLNSTATAFKSVNEPPPPPRIGRERSPSYPRRVLFRRRPRRPNALRRIAVEADNDIDIVGGSLSASGDLTLIAGGDVDIAPQLVDQVVETLQSSSGLFSSKHKLTTTTTLTNDGADLSAGDNLDIAAGGDLTLQAADVGGGAIYLAAGGSVDLDLAINQVTQSVTGTSSNLLTNTIYDHGYSDESAVYNEIEAGAGGLTIEAGDGVNVQTASIGPGPSETLAALEGAGVDPSLSTVTLTDQTWNHDHATLSAAAAALIALVVAVVTAGVGDVVTDAVFGTAAATTVAATAAVDGVSVAAESLALATGISAPLAAAATSGVSAFVSGAISGPIVEGIDGDFNLGNVLTGALAARLAGALHGPVPDDDLGRFETFLAPNAEVPSKAARPCSAASGATVCGTRIA